MQKQYTQFENEYPLRGNYMVSGLFLEIFTEILLTV